jgi:hypothetical protein
MTTYQEARDEMCALFRTRWEALAPAIVGALPEVVWPDSTVTEITDGSKYWARVSFATVTEYQATLRGAQGVQRRWTTEGLVTVQVFAPMSDALGARKLNLLAPIARDAFRGTKAALCVWFRRARVIELERDGKWHRSNAVAAYQYDEIR